MTSMFHRRWVYAGCCLALLASPARAGTPEEERRYAIEIGQTAIELYGQGQYRVALERFRAAARVQHSPVFTLYEARCLHKLRRLAEARSKYVALLSEQLPADAAPAWRAALSDAAIELAALEPRVPGVRITISGAAPAALSLSLSLDGAPLAVPSAGSELRLNPGAHELEARDGRVAKTRFALAEGERNKSVQLRFPARLPDPLPTPPGQSEPIAAPSSGTVRHAMHAHVSKPASDAFGISLLSSAGAGVIVGSVTGLLAFVKLQNIRENCQGNVCAKSDEDEGETVGTLALISTVGFCVGAVSLGAWGLRVALTPAPRPGSALSSTPALRLSGSF